MKLLVVLAMTFVALTILTSRVATEQISFQTPAPTPAYAAGDVRMAMVERLAVHRPVR